MEKINVALAFYDFQGTYCQHAAATIASILSNTNSIVSINILHDVTLTNENLRKLQELTDSFRQEIRFIKIPEDIFKEKNIDIDKLGGAFTRGALFRLMLPELLGEEKVIYLDCDVLVNMDIAELWNIDLQDKAVAVAPDVPSLNYLEYNIRIPKRHDILWNMLGIKRGEYFNSGVLLMNLKKIQRNYDLIKECKKFFANFGKCTYSADQDCLNVVFNNDKLLIDERFNRIRGESITTKNIYGNIWHLAARKPWEDYTRSGLDELYWKYLRMTPYCKNESELITVMLKTLTSSRLCHKHSGSCINRLRKQFLDETHKANLLFHVYLKHYYNKLQLYSIF